MGHFDTIFNKFEQLQAKNERYMKEEAERIQKEKEALEQNICKGVIMEDYETHHISDELLELIKKYGFVIEGYENHDKKGIDEENYYNRTMETYYCAFNDWHFAIKNRYDVDIDEGIFAIYEFSNKKSNATHEIYIDLGCRNTGRYKVDAFLQLLTFETMQAFVKHQYQYLLDLPSLLETQGYDIKPINYKFLFSNATGGIKIDDNIIMKIDIDQESGIAKCCFYKAKSLEELETGIFEPKVKYKCDYHSSNDLGKLCNIIDIFKDELSGNIGFFENGKYYKNIDFVLFFESFKSVEKPLKECWNHYHIKMDITRQKEDKVAGLEIYCKGEIAFNDAAQWSKGPNASIAKFIFEYDKQKNDKQCILKIDHFLKHNFIDCQSDLPEEEFLETTTFKGGFNELCDILREYIEYMCKLYNIEL